MYTKQMFKQKIKKIICEEGYSPEKIGKKAFDICMENIRTIDEECYDFLMDVATMENGPEFEMTEEEFKKFLDEM